MPQLENFPEPVFLAGWEDLGYSVGMSNFDHTITEGFTDTLARGKCFGRHAAWDFNGLVWQGDDGRYYEAVYCYRVYESTFVANTLESLMDDVNQVYGSD